MLGTRNSSALKRVSVPPPVESEEHASRSQPPGKHFSGHKEYKIKETTESTFFFRRASLFRYYPELPAGWK